MDKEKIMGHLQRKMNEKYINAEVLERCDALALKVEGKVVARFNDWDPDNYIMGCDSELIEKVLRTDILLDFYRYGRKELKKPLKKYTIKVLKNEAAPDDGYLKVDYQTNGLKIANKNEFNGWRTSFTKNEIEELKKNDDLAIDWNKVELEEVDNAK